MFGCHPRCRMSVLALVAFLAAVMARPQNAPNPRPLPQTILAGYPGSGYSSTGPNEPVLEAVRNGVNVVIWNFIILTSDPQTGNPVVSGAPPLSCVVDTVKALEAQNLTTTHLISIGGWDAPHPAAFNPVTGKPYTALELYSAWDDWNTNAATQYNWNGFDGMDWDMEGANQVSSPTNEFTVACLDLVGQMSQLAKADGYIVSLVPPESYFDPTTGNFSRSLLFDYPEWASRVSFFYHGRNAYAYLTARYGDTQSSVPPKPSPGFVTS